MGSLQSFQGFSAAKLHELQILISLALHNETVVTPREVLWMQKVTQQLCIWWGCRGPSHQPATWRVAFFNAPLLVSLNTSSLLVFTPCLSVAQRQPRTKHTTFLSSFEVFFSFASHFLFHFCFSQTGIGQSTSNLFLRQAEPQWVFAGLKGFLPSLWLFQHPLPFGQGERTWAHELRHTPLLVVGDSRTAGILETNQFDSILQALFAFLTSVLKI